MANKENIIGGLILSGVLTVAGLSVLVTRNAKEISDLLKEQKTFPPMLLFLDTNCDQMDYGQYVCNDLNHDGIRDYAITSTNSISFYFGINKKKK
jgi:hypothetical protein